MWPKSSYFLIDDPSMADSTILSRRVARPGAGGDRRPEADRSTRKRWRSASNRLQSRLLFLSFWRWTSLLQSVCQPYRRAKKTGAQCLGASCLVHLNWSGLRVGEPRRFWRRYFFFVLPPRGASTVWPSRPTFSLRTLS